MKQQVFLANRRLRMDPSLRTASYNDKTSVSPSTKLKKLCEDAKKVKSEDLACWLLTSS